MSNAVAIPQTEAMVPRPARKIRVLHLIHSVCHGGIESSMINWVRYMDRENFDVHIAYFAGDRNREEPFLRVRQDRWVARPQCAVDKLQTILQGGQGVGGAGARTRD